MSLLLIIPGSLHAEEPPPESMTINDPLPFGLPPVDYQASATDNPLARLNRRLEEGTARLSHGGRHGYLRSLLKALEIPLSSQVLVFSKTARNQREVGPKRPRAIYFNETTYVGWVPGTAKLEAAAIDAQKGGVFYTLSQRGEAKPRLHRDASCLACHAGRTTHRVPGFLIRSFLTDERGKPQVGYSRVTHETELAKRWGGWYVTGQHGAQPHHGNLVGEDDRRRHRRNQQFGGNVTDLGSYFDVADYPAAHSDILAHLVLNHQAYGQTLLVRVHLEDRLNRRSDAEERLLRYLLLVDAAPIRGTIRGTSGFRKWFENQCPPGSPGHALRQLDLRDRLFERRLSYLIDTPAFANLSEPVKNRLYRRLWDVLSGQDDSPGFQSISATERKRLIALVRRLKDDLPDCWHNRCE